MLSRYLPFLVVASLFLAAVFAVWIWYECR